ncbi:NADPH-dependent F420 reductase [Microbacterium hominis]|uniref:NAD(P)-binding domain-containing protein n=1 Tax=Microbacterium hominis TaxID=162426 RepID=A0A7D4TPB4_9MICO|nr:NAD(P)-binding domain-containing protein [Microbacterium hominis]QKJ18064.1 NAD(P)-binding domain-containing protein [Microbacterium hominis]
MTTFGIIGAGHIGSQVARALTRAGHEVVIANSREPETLADLIEELGPLARAATATDAAEAAEVAVVAVPMRAIGDVPVEQLAGKVVLDTNNYYWERDGHIPALDAGEATTSGLLQAHLPTSMVAKAFNNIYAHEITTTGAPAGTSGRRALGTASDFPEAIAVITEVYDALGFDTVSAGELDESWRLERDRPGYGAVQTVDEMRANLAAANRIRPEDAT